MRYTLKEKKPLPKSEYLLALEIPAEEIAHCRAEVLSRLRKDMEFPGFRKGFVPEKIIRERMGELALWEEAATDALGGALAEIFHAEKLDVIGRPRVETRKLAPENPAEFRVTLSLYPELTLPEYKKIAAQQNAKKKEPVLVGEKDIDTVISEIKKQHEAATGTKGFTVTDESVKAFGAFNTITDFRAKVKEGLLSHKDAQQKEKRRAELLDALTGKAEGDIPEVMILSELSRMESELRSEIERVGGSFDAYLKEIKKDANALQQEWRKDAERRARLQLTLFLIARAEKLNAPEKEIEEEAKRLLEQYKNASPENARSYVETLLTNRNVISFLEDQK